MNKKTNFQKVISLFLILSFLNLNFGCNYYISNTLPKDNFKSNITQLQKLNKFIIVHTGEKVGRLSNIVIENNILTATVSPFKGHTKYITTDTLGVNRYKLKESEVLQEVHVYISSFDKFENNQIVFNLSNIKRIEMYEPETGLTTLSWVFGIAGIVTSAALFAGIIFIIIALATKQSCPFIYAFDGKEYKLCGEIFSGATQPPLERNDFLPINWLKETNGEYKIKITNEVKEIQNTNMMQLVVFDHPQGTKVLIDKYGNVQTATNIISPKSAVNLLGEDVSKQIANQDSISYLGDDISKTDNVLNGVVMSFDKPKDATIAKVFIRAKNNFWLDYVYGKFNDMFGDKYEKWSKTQEKESAKSLMDWSLNQNIPLKVYIEKNGKWEFADYFNVAGPMALKEDVLSINVTNTGNEPLKLKLEAGAFFWEIDYVGVDYTNNVNVKRYDVAIADATNQKGDNVSKLLQADDKLYYSQPNVGDMAIVTFKAPVRIDNQRTIILHSKGYYHILNDSKGKPNIKKLITFKQPTAFNKFSMELLRNYSSTAKKL